MNLVKKPRDPEGPFPHRPKPSPASEMFASSAAVTRSLQDCALLIGKHADEIHELTMLPLSAEHRVIAIAALRLCRRFDSLRADLEFSLIELQAVRARLESSLIEGRRHQFKE